MEMVGFLVVGRMIVKSPLAGQSRSGRGRLPGKCDSREGENVAGLQGPHEESHVPRVPARRWAITPRRPFVRLSSLSPRFELDCAAVNFTDESSVKGNRRRKQSALS